MPNPNDPQQDIHPTTEEETPVTPRSGAPDEEVLPMVPFGEDPGTLGVDDPTVE